MAGVLSKDEFLRALQQMCGTVLESAEELLPFYDEAVQSADLALPRLPKLGIFSSQDTRVAAFISTCIFLDEQVQKGKISPDGTQVALLLLMLSNKDFYRATKAFANYAYPFRNRAMTSDSDTVIRWFNSGIASQ